jgi:pyridoxal phosphate enzyme (YggS family)
MRLVDEPELALIRNRYERLQERLAVAAKEAGRDPASVRVVAVTKGFGTRVVRAALEAGLTSFGENRVQEASDKVAAAPDADWHMVGHLQGNKVRAALRLFRTIHSVDSVDLLARIERIAHDDGHSPRLLLEVEMSGAERRSGFELGWFDDQVAREEGQLVAALRELRHATVIGLMAIAPLEHGQTDHPFATLRELRDRLRLSSGLPLPELSMGMTADAEEAVREGATLVRIGTAIFGPRPERH